MQSDWQTSLQVQTDMICTLDRSMQPHCAELENWMASSGRPWGFATSGHVPAQATAEDVLAELAPGGWGGVGGGGAVGEDWGGLVGGHVG